MRSAIISARDDGFPGVAVLYPPARCYAVFCLSLRPTSLVSQRARFAFFARFNLSPRRIHGAFSDGRCTTIHSRFGDYCELTPPRVNSRICRGQFKSHVSSPLRSPRRSRAGISAIKRRAYAGGYLNGLLPEAFYSPSTAANTDGTFFDNTEK